MNNITSENQSLFGKLLDWLKLKIKLNSLVENAKKRIVYRGGVYICNFGINVGSEQEKSRPCLIIQNNNANKSSSNVIVAPFTSTLSEIYTVVTIKDKIENGKLILKGSILLGNIVTVSKARLGNKLTTLTDAEMKRVDTAIISSLGLTPYITKKDNIIRDKDTYISILKSKIVD